MVFKCFFFFFLISFYGFRVQGYGMVWEFGGSNGFKPLALRRNVSLSKDPSRRQTEGLQRTFFFFHHVPWLNIPERLWTYILNHLDLPIPHDTMTHVDLWISLSTSQCFTAKLVALTMRPKKLIEVQGFSQLVSGFFHGPLLTIRETD